MVLGVKPTSSHSMPSKHSSGSLVCVFMKNFSAAWSHSVAPTLDQ